MLENIRDKSTAEKLEMTKKEIIAACKCFSCSNLELSVHLEDNSIRLDAKYFCKATGKQIEEYRRGYPAVLYCSQYDAKPLSEEIKNALSVVGIDL